MPLPFSPFAPETDYQKSVVGVADSYAKDIVAGILARFERQGDMTLHDFYASLASTAGVWPTDPSSAMVVIDDIIEDEEGHPLENRTLYQCTVALVHHDMLTAIVAERKAGVA